METTTIAVEIILLIAVGVFVLPPPLIVFRLNKFFRAKPISPERCKKCHMVKRPNAAYCHHCGALENIAISRMPVRKLAGIVAAGPHCGEAMYLDENGKLRPFAWATI